MATPTKTLTLNTFYAATYENRRPGLVDNFFGSAPLLAYIRKRENVLLRGGRDIQENFVYSSFAASSYGRGTEFDTTTKEFSTTMIFNWKFIYAPVNLDVIDVDLNDSPEQVFDLVEAAMETGELSLIDNLSTQLFADGSGNGSLDIDGLANAISRTTTVSYGGITRSSTAGTPGNALLAGAENTTGGALSLAQVNADYGSCVIAREKPDLIVTTQTLWNRIWERSQPSERTEMRGSAEERNLGFESVRLNAADVTVDSHCPSGNLYLINTKWWRFYTHQKWDFRFRGFNEPTNQQRMIGQLIVWGNLVCRSPRLQGYESGLT
jgi:hypothetical protein